MKQKLHLFLFLISLSIFGKNINEKVYFNPAVNSLTSNGSTCEGDNAIFEIIGTPNADVSYNINGGGSQVIVLNSSGYGQISISSVITDQTIYLTSIQLGGDFTPLTNTETVTVIQTPVLTISNSLPISLCNNGYLNILWSSNVPGTTLIFTSVSNNVIGFPGAGDETTLNQNISLSNPNLSGDITIMITPYANGCSGLPVTVSVQINAAPIIVSIAADSNIICSGDYVTFNVTGNLFGINYNWQVVNSNNTNIIGGITNGTISTGELTLNAEAISPGISGSFEVMFTPIKNGCFGASMSSFPITVNPTPGQPIGIPEYFICDGNTTSVNINSSPFISGTELIFNVVSSNNVNGYSSGGPLPAPLLINDLLTLNDPSTNGYVVYRVQSLLNGCLGGYSDFTVNVNSNPQPTLVDGEIIIEQPSGIVITPYILDSGLNNTNYSFEWYHNNILINGATDNIYTATESGNYHVIATDLTSINNCVGYSNTAIVTENTLNSEDFNLKNNIKIYPNPANETLNIFSDKTPILSISIVNMIGQKLKSKEINSNDFKINISDLSLGSYFIQLNTSNGNKIIKFVKN